MAESREDRIRRRAHEIWEREGRPEGLHEVHWLQASREIDAEDGETTRTSGRRGRSGSAGTLTNSVRRSAKRAAEAVSGTVEAVSSAVSEVAKAGAQAVKPKRLRKEQNPPVRDQAMSTPPSGSSATPKSTARRGHYAWSPADIKPTSKSETGNTRKAAASLAQENAGAKRGRSGGRPTRAGTKSTS